jgi:multiple sugar transport system permease protein
MFVTSLKARVDTVNPATGFIPFVQFTPTLENYRAVFTNSGVLVAKEDVSLSTFPTNLLHSAILALSATFLSVTIGTLTAYTFSRFKVRGESDIMFFILSTRMLPAVVVLIPIVILFSAVRLNDTFLGMIILYTTFNLPFVVWVMKGFFDDIPKEYEEAAMMDGHSRLQAIYKIVIPEALPAMLATAVFAMITTWNEFVFANLLAGKVVTTAPPFIAKILGVGVTEWGKMSAAAIVFMLPVVVFTIIVRNYLLRGVTFGAVRR